MDALRQSAPFLDPRAVPPHAAPSGATPPHSRRFGRLRDLTLLLRPGQWPKNLIAVPLALVDIPSWTSGVLLAVGRAILVFTLASALIYLVNDVSDRHRDRNHPTKRFRPLAAGRVGLGGVTALAAALIGLLALTMSTGPLLSWWPVVAYVGLNVAYSRGLKHVSLLDAFIVAAGFVLRLLQGYAATDERPSTWLALCVFCACLLLLLGKRRHEISVSGSAHRPSLQGYSVVLLDQLLGLAAALAAVSYLLYLQHDPPFSAAVDLFGTFSVPCALFGLARYLQVLIVERGGENPVHTLFRDRLTLVNLAVWSGLFGTGVLLTHIAA